MSAPACTGPGGRGCPCPWHVRRRAYHARYAQAKRDAQLARRNERARVCQYRQGQAICGAVLDVRTDGDGRTIVTCPRCERRKRGICQDCPAPVAGRVGSALRCAKHQREAQQRHTREWELAHQEEKRAAARAHYHDPAVRARRNEYKRAWRKANPEKVRAQKKRYVARHAGDPESQYARYHARYRARHQAYYRELQRRRDAAKPRRTSPRCTKCGRATRWTPIPGVATKPWSKCSRCCWPHELKARRARRRAALKRAELLAQQKVTVRPPKAAAPRGPGLERLCVSCGDIVLTGRKKKCTRCRARDRQQALEALAPLRGRGRRTDLQRQERVA